MASRSLGSTDIDIKPEIYLAAWRTALSYLSFWQFDPQFELPSFKVEVAPVAAFIGVPQAIGLNAGRSTKALHGLLVASTGWGAARLYRRPAPDGGDVAPFPAAAFVLANPGTALAGPSLAIALTFLVMSGGNRRDTGAHHDAGALAAAFASVEQGG
jgi:hypothetical protein